MALQFSTALRDDLNDAITAALDGGAGAAIVAIYSGAKPSAVSTALSGNTLLAKIALNDPSFGASSSAVITADNSPVPSATAAADGTAAWARVYSSADGSTISEANAVTQGTVTATGGGGDFEIDNTSIVSGQTVNLTSWTITAPGA